jgi:hypothetical protein
MQQREFTDPNGVTWQVRATFPAGNVASTLPESFAKGWLTFESSEGAVRRLAPIPDEWESCSESRLVLLSRVATPARARTETPTAPMRAIEKRE